MEIPETREELLAEQQVLPTRIADARRRLAIVRVAVEQHRTAEDSTSASMSDRVVDVLRAGGVMSPSEIVDALRRDDPDVHARSIGGVLNALREQGRGGRAGRGQWFSQVE